MGEIIVAGDDESSATVTLPDGREIGYARYGSKNGVPVICLHGLPGSRIDYARFNSLARTVGARIIAVDRPGIGLSSFHPEGSLLTFAKDVEHLTNALGLDSYAVLVCTVSCTASTKLTSIRAGQLVVHIH